jgi:hypothetical protein
MKPLYIFDLDGTLALIEHRRHMIDSDLGNHDWTGFYAACVDDAPNAPVIRVMEMLLQTNAEVWIFSGRSDEVRTQTIAWLAAHTRFTADELAGPMLTMRAARDYTPDDTLKKSWLDAMLPQDRARLQCTFDDRDRVVKMWRAAGVSCFQVAAGDF